MAAKPARLARARCVPVVGRGLRTPPLVATSVREWTIHHALMLAATNQTRRGSETPPYIPTCTLKRLYHALLCLALTQNHRTVRIPFHLYIIMGLEHMDKARGVIQPVDSSQQQFAE